MTGHPVATRPQASAQEPLRSDTEDPVKTYQAAHSARKRGHWERHLFFFTSVRASWLSLPPSDCSARCCTRRWARGPGEGSPGWRASGIPPAQGRAWCLGSCGVAPSPSLELAGTRKEPAVSWDLLEAERVLPAPAPAPAFPSAEAASSPSLASSGPGCLQPLPFFFSSLKCEPQSHYRQTGCSSPTRRDFRQTLGSNRILLAVVGPICHGPGVGGGTGLGARRGTKELASSVTLGASGPDSELGGHL